MKHTYAVIQEDGTREDFTYEHEDRAYALHQIIEENYASFMDAARVLYIMTPKQVRNDILWRVNQLFGDAPYTPGMGDRVTNFIKSALRTHKAMGRDIDKLRKFEIVVDEDDWTVVFPGVEDDEE